MERLKGYLEDSALWVGREWDEIVDRLGWGRDKPVMVADYRGFARPNYLFLTGRVLRDRAISRAEQDRFLKNLVNNFKRFNSREIPGAHVTVDWQGHRFERITDGEGYFRIEEQFDPPVHFAQPDLWQQAKITVDTTPEDGKVEVCTYVDIMVPQPGNEFGVITDIDDTVLQTDVTSRLKLKTMYHTLFRNAHTRTAFQQVSAFFHALQKGPDGQGNNPFFYVSNSPWNLYDLLADFLMINRMPKGPIMLRDFGLPYQDRPEDYRGHKLEQIERIMNAYPDLKFVLVGDSGEKDADIYLTIAGEFPKRIQAIYIRDVQHQKRTARVESLIERVTDISVKIVDSYEEAATHAALNVLIRREDFDEYNHA